MTLLPFRVVVRVPGKERAQQVFARSQKEAEQTLKQILDAGQPHGTTWKVYESKEEVLVEGTVE